MMKRIVKKNLSDDAKAALLQLIHTMDFQKTTKLPPEAELADQLGVSRITIRRALSDIENAGFILRIQGRGTYINPSALLIKVNLSPMQEFGEVIKQSGHLASSHLVSLTQKAANAEEAAALQIEGGAQLFRVIRLYKADGMAAILSDAVIPVSLFPALLPRAKWENHSNFELLYSEAGEIVKSDRIEIACFPTEELRKAIPAFSSFACSSVLSLIGIGYDQEQKPVIFGNSYYNTEIIKFNMYRQG